MHDGEASGEEVDVDPPEPVDDDPDPDPEVETDTETDDSDPDLSDDVPETVRELVGLDDGDDSDPDGETEVDLRDGDDDPDDDLDDDLPESVRDLVDDSADAPVDDDPADSKGYDCGNCGCELSYLGGVDRDGGGKECPECGERLLWSKVSA